MTDQMYCVLDYETRSETDLGLCGAYEYSVHPTTEILVASWRIGTRQTLKTQPTKWWSYYKPSTARELVDAMLNPEIILVAHNALFEQCITRNTLYRKFRKPGLNHIPISRWLCTAALCRSYALPGALEKACQVLSLEHQKDMSGHRLMLRMAKPKKPSKKDPSYWANKKAQLDALIEYNIQDVNAEVDVFLSLDPLIDQERKVWELDQQINQRGFYVDRPLVQDILELIKHETFDLNNELKQVTDGAVESNSQRARLFNWLKGEGVELPDLTASTVLNALETLTLAQAPKRALEIRRDLAKTSTAKYEAFESRSRSDSRVRDNIIYHTASTGRWGGAGVQPQNFPRPTFESSEISGIIETINVSRGTGTRSRLDFIRTLYGNPMSVFSSILRSMIKATPDHRLFGADYSSIEVRVLFWLAEHTKGVEAFAQDKDLYVEMASSIFNRPEAEILKTERQLGKTAILGCFTGNTQILTPRGWVSIINLRSSDKVWDGIEWTNHEGIICQGQKNVLFLKGIGVTPDHQILTQEGWESAFRVAKENTKFQSAINLANLSLKPLYLAQEAGFLKSKQNAHAVKNLFKTRTILYRVNLKDVIFALKNKVLILIKSIGVMKIFYLICATGKDCLTVFPLRYSDAITPNVRSFPIMADEVSTCINHGVQTEKSFLNTYCRLKDGISLIWKWIESMLTKGINRIIYVLPRGMKTSQIEDLSYRCKTKLWPLKQKYHVYDVKNAGPRNRFTVLTDEGPLIVHNCGYGMGSTKFFATCENQKVVGITESLAEKAVYTYRKIHYPVVKLWKTYETCALNAVKNPGKVFFGGRVKWIFEKDFLKCKLPSGRCLHYASPEIRYGDILGFPRPSLHYKAVNSLTRNWEGESTYGGKLTENITQAVSRDLLANAMLNIEKAGYQITMSVHDEIVAEAEFGDLKEFEKIMETLPPWAEGLPVKAKGFENDRYGK